MVWQGSEGSRQSVERPMKVMEGGGGGQLWWLIWEGLE